MVSLNYKYLGERLSPGRIAWIKKFHEFNREIQSRSNISSDYTQRATEVFARFVARFVSWTENTATGSRWSFEEPIWDDKFNARDYYNFIALLQEKSYLDTAEPFQKKSAIGRPQERDPFSDTLQQQHPGSEVDLRVNKPEPKRQVVNLEWLFVQKGIRKEGIGTAVMEDITAWADQNNVTLTLSLADKDRETGTTSKERLRRFYTQFGFVSNRGRHKDYSLSMYVNMYRKPQGGEQPSQWHVQVHNEVTDAYKGQINGRITATNNTGPVGSLDWMQYGDTVTIAMIRVPEASQRQGIALKMLEFLQQEFPGKKILWGMTTPDGTKLQEAWNARTAAAADHDGFFVALFCDPASAKTLVQKDGEAEDDLHVTLCYCADVDTLDPEDVTRAIDAVRGIAATSPPLEGVVGGWGRFTASPSSDGKEPVYASPDVPGLTELREKIAAALIACGVPPKSDHGYTPHITLKFAEEGDEWAPTLPEKCALTFDTITVRAGKKKEPHKFPLQGTKKTAEYNQPNPLLGELGWDNKDFRDYEETGPGPPTWISTWAKHYTNIKSGGVFEGTIDWNISLFEIKKRARVEKRKPEIFRKMLGWQSDCEVFSSTSGLIYHRERYFPTHDDAAADIQELMRRLDAMRLDEFLAMAAKTGPRLATRSPREMMEWLEIEGFIKEAGGREDYLAKLGAPPDVTAYILQQDEKTQKWLINEFRKNPQLTLAEITALEPPQGFTPSPEEQEFVARYPEAMQKWVMTQLRKARVPFDGDWSQDDLQQLRTEGRWSHFLFPISPSGDPWGEYGPTNYGLNAWSRIFNRIRDWFDAVQPDIASYDFTRAWDATEAWHQAIAAQGGGKIYTEHDVLYTFGENDFPSPVDKKFAGWTIQRVSSANDLKVEGNKMNHCVGGYDDKVAKGKCEIYSLRDPRNEPHVTMEIQKSKRGGLITKQIKGKNDVVMPKAYMPAIRQWAEEHDVVLAEDEHAHEWEDDYNDKTHTCSICEEEEDHEWDGEDGGDTDENGVPYAEQYHVCSSCGASR
jgi:GNAT superfamily N-acetyltransferase